MVFSLVGVGGDFIWGFPHPVKRKAKTSSARPTGILLFIEKAFFFRMSNHFIGISFLGKTLLGYSQVCIAGAMFGD